MYTHTTEAGVVYRIYDDLKEFVSDIPKDIPTYKDKKTTYLRIPAGFDIETTTVKRYSFMYHAQFSLGDQIYLFRTWYDFEQLYGELQKLCKKAKARLLIWVANLGYEFSYVCRRIKISRVFAKSERHPLTVDSGKIQFRDCLAVSGQGGLANLAKNYCKTPKLVGDLDYSVLRNSKSTLTPKEIAYCINDVAILSEWGTYCFNRWIINGVGHIPLTITGICREEVKKAAGKNLEKIRKLVHECYPKTKEQYQYMMRYLFRGGFTHANIFHVGREVKKVIGIDFTSSYPSMMLHYLYPVTPFVKTTLECDGHEITDERLLDDSWGCWMVVEFWSIKGKTLHSIESAHKVIAEDGAYYDNGRLMEARYIRVALTEIDYDIYCDFYEWRKMNIVYAATTRKAPLPDYLIKPLMDAYQEKTRLKRAKLDDTVEYKNSKTIVNSFYGMTVTRLSFTDWTFDGSADNPWKEVQTQTPYSAMIKDQILLPQWGIWVTAYARQCLLKIVKEMDPDMQHNNVIYCDTDSIYFIDNPRCREIVETWNLGIRNMNTMFPSEFDDIGCFDYIDGGNLYRFKTLGAKRYIKMDADGHTTVTVAGMRKGTYERTIAEEEPPEGEYVYVKIKNDEDGTVSTRYMSVDDFFDRFDDLLLLTAEQSCKIAAIYHDEPYSADVDGECMQELSGCALVDIPFRITVDRAWMKDAFTIQKKLRRSDLYD